jgi:hypothetical protein
MRRAISTTRAISLFAGGLEGLLVWEKLRVEGLPLALGAPVKTMKKNWRERSIKFTFEHNGDPNVGAG